MPRDAAPHGHQAPATIVLPGESLSKYGGTPAGEDSKSAPESAAPPRRSYTFKALYADRCADCLGWQRICCRENRFRGIADASRKPRLNRKTKSPVRLERSKTAEEFQEAAPSHYETEIETEEAGEPGLEFEEESLDEDADEMAFRGRDCRLWKPQKSRDLQRKRNFEETTGSAPAESEAMATEADDEDEEFAGGRRDGCVCFAPRRSFVADGLPAVRLWQEEGRRSLPKKKAATSGFNLCAGRRPGRRRSDRGRGVRRRTPSAPPQARSARSGRLRRGDTALAHAHRRPGRNVPGGAPRPPHPAELRRKGRRGRRGRRRRGGRGTTARAAQPGSAAANAAIAGSVDARPQRRAIAAAPRAARRKPRICPSSRTC